MEFSLRGAAVVHEPPERQRGAALRLDLDRDLVRAPPTRRDLTSSIGRTFSTAFLRVITGSFAVRSLIISSAL